MNPARVISPPKRNSQKLNAFRRGKATFLVPIIIGTI